MLQPARRFGTARRVGRRPIRPANKGLWRAGSRGWQAVLEHAQVGLAHLFDKALDIRAMIHERLLEMETTARWTTRPVLAGVQQPSQVRAQQAAAVAKTCQDIEPLIASSFKVQPVTSVEAQRRYLENMKSRLAHSLFLGVSAEAGLRALIGSLKSAEQMIVDTVRSFTEKELFPHEDLVERLGSTRTAAAATSARSAARLASAPCAFT